MTPLLLSLPPRHLFCVQPIKSEKPINMENLPVNGGNGQSFGYILYETSITSSGILSGRVRDRGQVGASLLNSCDLLMSSPAIRVSFCPSESAITSCKYGPSESALRVFMGAFVSVLPAGPLFAHRHAVLPFLA